MMKKWFDLLRKRIPTMWVIASLLVTLLLAGGVSYLHAEKTHQGSRASTAPSSEEVLARLDSILRDESMDPSQRISRALEVLGGAQRSGKSSAGASSAPADDNVDRLPWLEEPEPDIWARPWGMDWDPWQELQAMRQRMDRLIRETWRRFDEHTRGARGFAWGFSPRGEFEQTDDAYIYRFDLPGVDKSNVTVTVENGRLTIEGKRESRRDESAKGMARREIFVGQFRRDITLPADADASRAESKLENGVLTVRIPRVKGATASSKQTIQVQ
ncbi:MAG: Hsp20/alpha crystallin family protein [Candidatus Sumerlaea chitinivorans]|jgi:HSP20 family protein|uniref:Heat shock protein Hsp20 n=1 Tax=Sumerlaea chitinivorans TaxID=2250252 RepID=A0A2Z4Y6M1_SUMC1|nr:heat shock protein Hsp20 [Candidatus Sumerlaea chitinivorans]MCX7964958.1 Hsp20/alpha crystallin family protein [Candidatus Sumerlaea chitinivorans]